MSCPPASPPLPVSAVRAEDHVGLVHAYLARFNFSPLEREEAFAIGCEALVRAAEGFDPSLGWRFATYAWPSIWRAIQRERVVAIRRLSVETSGPFRVRGRFGDEEGEEEVHGLFFSDPTDTILLREILEAVEALPAQQRKVMMLKLEDPFSTFESISEHLGVSRQRVHQILLAARYRLARTERGREWKRVLAA